MLKIAQHIEYLLLLHDQVGVPTLGTFKAVSHAAHYDEERNTLAAPTRQVEFIAETTSKDILLQRSLQQALAIDARAASTLIKQEVRLIKAAIARENGRITLSSLGCLISDEYGKPQFVPHAKAVTDLSLFGLAPLQLSPIIQPVAVDEEQSPFIEKRAGTIHLRFTQRRLAQSIVAAVVIVLFMLGITPVEYHSVKQDYASIISSFVATPPTANPAIVVEAAPQPEVVIAEQTPSLLLPTEEIAGSYLVIVSSLPTLDLAETEVLNLSRKYGIKEQLHIYQSATRSRLYMSRFTTASAAYQYIAQQKASGNFPFADAWVLRAR